MVKKRQQPAKKGKSASGTKSKSQKGKKGAAKRGAKHPKSKGSKRSTSSSSNKHGQRKAPKAPSKFNLYMKTTVQKVKQDHPGITQKDAFKQAAEQWAMSPENPKNMHL